MQSLVQECRNRGFGGVTVMIKPMVKHEVVTKVASKHIPLLSVRLYGVTICGVCVSRSAKASEETEALATIQRISRGAAVTIGDLSARSTVWDKKVTISCRRLVKWAVKYNWTIRATKEPTVAICVVGTSTFDIPLMKGLLESEIKVPLIGAYKSREHQPVYTTITLPKETYYLEGIIPIPTRSDIRLL